MLMQFNNKTMRKTHLETKQAKQVVIKKKPLNYYKVVRINSVMYNLKCGENFMSLLL